MSFFEKIKIIASKVWVYLLPAFKTFLKAYGPVLLQTAEKVCLQLIANQIPGAEKQQIAFVQIQNELLQKGFQVASREINKTIEIVLDKIEADKTLTGGGN